MIAGREPHYGLLEHAAPAQSKRRRWAALAMILAVALAGALLGQLSAVRNDEARPVPPGPLDQIPH